MKQLIDVYCLTSYKTKNTEIIDEKSTDFWPTVHLITGLKGSNTKLVRGYVPDASTPFSNIVDPNFTREQNQQNAARFFAGLAQKHLQSLGVTSAKLIPVPSKAVLNLGFPDHASHCFSQHIVNQMGNSFSLSPAFYWSQALSSSREGGTRNADVLYDSLVFDNSIAQCQPSDVIILVDDFCTSGAHMQACAARLNDVGLTPFCGLAASKPAAHSPEDFFKVRRVQFDYIGVGQDVFGLNQYTSVPF